MRLWRYGDEGICPVGHYGFEAIENRKVCLPAPPPLFSVSPYPRVSASVLSRITMFPCVRVARHGASASSEEGGYRSQ